MNERQTAITQQKTLSALEIHDLVISGYRESIFRKEHYTPAIVIGMDCWLLLKAGVRKSSAETFIYKDLF